MGKDINIVFAPLVLAEGLEAENAPQFARIMPRLLAAVLGIYKGIRPSAPILIVAVTEDNDPSHVIRRGFLGFSGEDDAERMEKLVQENEPDADFVVYGVLTALDPIQVNWELENVVAGFRAGKGQLTARWESLPKDLVEHGNEIADLIGAEGPLIPDPVHAFGSSDHKVLRHLIDGIDRVAAAEAGVADEVTSDTFAPFLDALRLAPGCMPAIHELAKLTINILSMPQAKEDWKDSALRAMETATVVSPESDYAHYMLGEAYIRLGRHDDTVESWKRAISLKPLLGIYPYRLGLLLEELGREEEARAVYEEGVKSAEPFHDLLDRLGIIRANDGDLEEAEKYWRAALKAVPESPTVFGHLARLEMERGHASEAALLFEQGLKTSEHFWGIYIHLADFFDYDRSRAESLMPLVEEQLPRFQEDGDALYAIGSCFQAAGARDKALRIFGQVSKISPNSEASNASARRLLQVAFSDFEPAFRKACEQVVKGEPEDAIGFLDSVVEANGNFWPAWYFLGVARRHSKMDDSALEAYNRVLLLNPENLDAMNEIAVIHSLRGEHSEAEKQYRRALSIEPHRPGIISNLAYCLFEQGRMEDAETEIARAVELAPDDEHVAEIAGRISSRKGKRGFWRWLLGRGNQNE